MGIEKLIDKIEQDNDGYIPFVKEAPHRNLKLDSGLGNLPIQ